MRRTLVFIAGLSLVGAQLVGAQIIDSRRGIGSRGPIAWTSLSIGWMEQQSLCDQDSGACWDFGSAPQWRGSLEFPMGRGATLGAAATTARVPLVYRGGVLGTNDCSGCDADANITQYFANLRIGGGSRGFQQVIDINAGMTVFSNFRTASGGTRLGPGKANSDASFSIGYGFGYGFTERLQVMLVQEFGLVIHERQSGSANNTAQQRVTRVGMRYGLGDK